MMLTVSLVHGHLTVKTSHRLVGGSLQTSKESSIKRISFLIIRANSVAVANQTMLRLKHFMNGSTCPRYSLLEEEAKRLNFYLGKVVSSIVC